MSFDPHATESIERYLNGTLSPAEREAFEEQASRDPRLRRSLVERHRERAAAPEWSDLPAEVRARVLDMGARQAGAPARNAARGATMRRTAFTAGLAAALAGVLGLGLWWVTRPPTVDPKLDETLREAPGIEAGSVELLSPPPESRLAGPALELAWREVPGATGYSVFLLDERGDIRSQALVTRPSCRFDLAAVSAGTAGELCWYVTAELADGGSLTSEVRCGTPVPAGGS